MKVQNKKLLLIITYCILSYCHKTLCQSGNNIHCPDSIWFQRNDTIWTASTMPYAQVKRVYRLSKSQLKEIKIKKHLGLYEVYGITTIELLDFFDGEVALYINDSLYKKQIYKSVITDAKDKPYNSFFIEINTTKQKTGKLKIIIDNCTLASNVELNHSKISVYKITDNFSSNWIIRYSDLYSKIKVKPTSNH